MKEFHKFPRVDELWSFFTSIWHFQQSGFVPLSHDSTTSSAKENVLESKQSQVLRRAEAVRGRLMSQKCLRMGTGSVARAGQDTRCECELHGATREWNIPKEGDVTSSSSRFIQGDLLRPQKNICGAFSANHDVPGRPRSPDVLQNLGKPHWTTPSKCESRRNSGTTPRTFSWPHKLTLLSPFPLLPPGKVDCMTPQCSGCQWESLMPPC